MTSEILAIVSTRGRSVHIYDILVAGMITINFVFADRAFALATFLAENLLSTL